MRRLILIIFLITTLAGFGQRVTTTDSLRVYGGGLFEGLITMDTNQIKQVDTATDQYDAVPLFQIMDSINAGTGAATYWERLAGHIYPKTITDSVGIGTSTPASILDVAGRITISNTGGSVFIGEGAGLNDDLSNNNNVFIGKQAGYSNTTGSSNTFNGLQAGYSNTTGLLNTFNGVYAGYSNTTGSLNTFNGVQAGNYIANGSTGRATGDNGLYLGYGTRASANGTFNEVVVGANAIGNGNNTATILDDNGTDVYMGENGQANVHLNGIYDSNDELGTASQVLSSTGTATDWVDVQTVDTARIYDSLARHLDTLQQHRIDINALVASPGFDSVDATNISSVAFYKTDGTEYRESFGHTHAEYALQTQVLPLYDSIDSLRADIGIGSFVPYTGATSDVELGNFALSADSIHADWFGGSDTKIGEAGSKLSIDMDSALLKTSPSVINGSTALVDGDAIYDFAVLNVAPIYDSLAIHLDTLQQHRIDINSISSIVAANIWSKTGNYVYQSVLTDSVGVGTNTPESPFHVAGLISQTGLGGSTFVGHQSGIGDDLTDNLNTGFGDQVLKTNTTGVGNSGFGYNTLFTNNGGYNCDAFGIYTLYSNTTGYFNSAFGGGSLYNITTGYQLTAVGYHAGFYVGSSTTTNTTSNASVYLGYDTRASANGGTNEVVIGANAIGNGDNTATIGDDNLTDLYAGEAGQANIHAANVDQYVKVTLSAAQVNTLGTRFTLIEAPGAGNVIQVTALSVFLDLGLQQEVGTQTLIFGINTGTEMYGLTNTELETSADLVVQTVQKNNAELIANEPFGCVLSAATNPTAGSVTMNVYISYKIITL